jgi:hypothetical protein
MAMADETVSSPALDFARRSDLRMLHRSLRRGWGVGPEVRRQAKVAVDALLADPGTSHDLRELAGRLAPLLAVGATAG